MSATPGSSSAHSHHSRNPPPSHNAYSSSSSCGQPYQLVLTLNTRKPLEDKHWKPPGIRITRERLPPYLLINSQPIRTHARFAHVFTRGMGVPGRSTRDNLHRELHSDKHFEVFGDAMLKGTVMDILAERYPQLTALAARLIADNTLSWLTWYYRAFGADDLHCMGTTGRSVWDSQTACADMFEAYLGGLVAEGGCEATRTWLERLYSQEVRQTLQKDC